MLSAISNFKCNPNCNLIFTAIGGSLRSQILRLIKASNFLNVYFRFLPLQHGYRGSSESLHPPCWQTGGWGSLLSGLTRWRRLDLDLLPVVPSSHAAATAAVVRWRVFSPLHLALVGKQILDVLLLQRAGGAAGCTHVQGAGQLTPLLVLVYLSQRTTRC